MLVYYGKSGEGLGCASNTDSFIAFRWLDSVHPFLINKHRCRRWRHTNQLILVSVSNLRTNFGRFFAVFQVLVFSTALGSLAMAVKPGDPAHLASLWSSALHNNPAAAQWLIVPFLVRSTEWLRLAEIPSIGARWLVSVGRCILDPSKNQSFVLHIFLVSSTLLNLTSPSTPSFSCFCASLSKRFLPVWHLSLKFRTPSFCLCNQHRHFSLLVIPSFHLSLSCQLRSSIPDPSSTSTFSSELYSILSR